MTVRWLGCYPGNFRKGRVLGLRPEFVVIHIMEGTLAGTDSWFADPVAEVSAHYGIGLDGSVHQYVLEEDTAYHAGRVSTSRFLTLQAARGASPNAFTIGIEHEGRADTPWTDRMYEASTALASGICSRWGIPADAQHIVMHREIYHKACPGSQFNRDRYLAALSEAGPVVPPVEPTPVELLLLKNTRVRKGRPNLSAPVVRVLTAGTRVTAVRSTQGEPVSGNSLWYEVDAANYLWAGGTDRPERSD